MKRKLIALGLALILISALPARSEAQFAIADVIKLVIKKVINSIDLAVQQLQNKTIVLQNAQQELENLMSKWQLDEISGWVEKQRELYETYYQELWQVKKIISGYDRVRTIISLQTEMVTEYRKAYGLFQQDKHFTPEELDHMFQVYTGILDESLKNVSQVLLVVNALATQMDDASRLNIIDQATAGIQKNFNDLRRFDNQNLQLSLERAVENNDLETVKNLYGIP